MQQTFISVSIIFTHQQFYIMKQQVDFLRPAQIIKLKRLQRHSIPHTPDFKKHPQKKKKQSRQVKNLPTLQKYVNHRTYDYSKAKVTKRNRSIGQSIQHRYQQISRTEIYSTLLPKQRKTFYLSDSIKRLRKLPIICKTNFRPELSCPLNCNTVPVKIDPLKTVQSENQRFEDSENADWMQESPKGYCYGSPQKDRMNKILGSQRGHSIELRFDAINKKLLRSQEVYKQKSMNIDSNIDWRI